jgi:hypothetical protein
MKGIVEIVETTTYQVTLVAGAGQLQEYALNGCNIHEKTKPIVVRQARIIEILEA